MNTNILIMAGGNGTRFWPKSRNALPKQFLDLNGNGSLLNQTIERVEALASLNNLYVVGNIKHQDLFKTKLNKKFPLDHVLLEPMARNTAAAVAAPTLYLHQLSGNQIIVVLPSDQHIQNTDNLQSQLKVAIDLAKQTHQVVTLGVKPTFPATGYGYLKGNASTHESLEFTDDKVFKLQAFIEKPNLALAKAFMKDDSYFWNAGIFVFESSVMIDHIKKHMPDLYNECAKIVDWHRDLETGKLQYLYELMPSESIDYGIMEKINEIYMVPLDCGWSDVGSWDALDTVKQVDTLNNITEGDIVQLDTISTTVIGNKKLIATVGVKDLVIVDTDDALLVCHKKDVQKIKKLVGLLKEKGRLQLL